MPAHHNAEAYVDAYLATAQIADDHKGPLFRSLDRERHLTERRLHRLEVLAMIKRRARQAGLPETTCCHTFRATGIRIASRYNLTLAVSLPHSNFLLFSSSF